MFFGKTESMRQAQCLGPASKGILSLGIPVPDSLRGSGGAFLKKALDSLHPTGLQFLADVLALVNDFC